MSSLVGVRRATIIGSSGGSALRAAIAILRATGRDPRPLVITDRDCGLLRFAGESQFESCALVNHGQDAFSVTAAMRAKDAGSSDVLLYYTRRVTGPLVTALRTCNIHPSLLPAFPGLHGVEDAIAAESPLLGATLHRVDAGLDTGPVLAQVSCLMPASRALAEAQLLSYLQKIWLTLAWFESLEHDGQLLEGPDEVAPAIECSTVRIADPAITSAYQRFATAAIPCG